MKSSKRAKKIVLASVVLLLIGVAVYKLATNEIVRCYLVRWSNLELIAPNVYVDPDMPESQRQILMSSIADAKERVATLYGKSIAEPIIIAGQTMDVMQTFGGNSYNRAGRTSVTPIATFIILGPDGVRSVDIPAHELAHAEFAARVGYWSRNKIPNWFDEGLALQFDERYSETEWQTRTDNGKSAPALDEIGIITHNDWLKCATAKHKVKRWLESVGQKGLESLLQSIQNGDDFQKTYRAIEQSTIR